MAGVSLLDGWTLWPTVEVRAAGFPVSMLSPYRSTDAVEAVRVANAAKIARDRHIDALRVAILAAREASPDETTWRALSKALKKVLRRQVPNAGPARIEPALLDARTADAAWIAADASADAAYRTALRTSGRAARALTHDDKFARAVLWQNASAYRGALRSLQKKGADVDNNQTRRAEMLAYSYLQRYATKNDTVGFFGPVGWGQIGSGTCRQKPGATLLESMSIQLEPWAVAAVADTLVDDDALCAVLAPRVSPRIRLEGNLLFGAPGRRASFFGQRVSAIDAALLTEADGQRGRDALIDDVTATLKVERAEVNAAFARLSGNGLLQLRLPVSISDAPEAHMTYTLERAGPAGQAALDRARPFFEAVAAVRGDVAAPVLDAALADVDAAFEALTKTAPERRPGEMYACRTLMLHNARRHYDLVLGDAFTDRIRAPLTAVLHAARWFCARAAQAFLSQLRTLFEKHRRGRDHARLVEVYEGLARLMGDGRPPFLATCAETLRDRWTAVIDEVGGGDATCVAVDPEALLKACRRAFEAPGPGWPSAKHHCPDMLICADSAEAFAQGAFTAVLGEVHPGINTLAILQAVTQHPRPEELVSAFRDDVSGRVVELQHDSYALCAQDCIMGPDERHLDTGSPWTSFLPDHPLRLGDFDVIDDDGVLMTRHVVSGERISLMRVLERTIKLNATLEFHLHTRGKTRPRIQAGDMILQRQAWALSSEDIEPVVSQRGAAQFAAAQTFRHVHGLPERVFARVAGETKPVMVDFSSPYSVLLWAKMAQGAAAVSVSEMLPDLDGVWLSDTDDERYVAELRMVATDPAPYRDEKRRNDDGEHQKDAS